MAGAARALLRATSGDALDLPEDAAVLLSARPCRQTAVCSGRRRQFDDRPYRTALTFQTNTAPSADMAAEQRNSER